MRKIASALVCLAFCLSTNTAGTTSAHNRHRFISEVRDSDNEMMIEDERLVSLPKEDRPMVHPVEICFDSIDRHLDESVRQQKSNQTHVVSRVTYYYPTGRRTSTGHSARGHEKIIALSPDLLKLIPYHSTVEVVGYGIYKVEDRTADHVRSTVDILLPSGKTIKNGRNVVIRVMT